MKLPAVLVLSTVALAALSASPPATQDIPRVYTAEHTGAGCATPRFPAFDELPTIRPLPDPFEKSDGRGRIAKFEDWRCRRAEIAAELQHYEIGEKPRRPASIEASYANGVLTVRVTENGETLTLTSPITLPEGKGPFPAVIGMGGAYGSLPADLFRSRSIVGIPFNFGQVMAHTQRRGQEPINKLYPGLMAMGAYAAWPWGVSRLIDGLELVAKDLPIDLTRLAVTGCSFAGKMAQFSGALDERIALTIPQEAGGGGGAAWRVSQTLGNVETLGKTSFAWFKEDLRRYANFVHKLPLDHHELMALVAPRALLVLGNPDYEWLADPSGYVAARAAQQVWEQFGIGERLGYSFVGGHPHCALPAGQRPEVEAFVDKFLLGKEANTSVRIHPFDNVNAERWFAWWGSGKPEFPDVTVDKANVESVFMEVECGRRGADWQVVRDAAASNGAYATIRKGANSPNAAPGGPETTITMPFRVRRGGQYYLFGRVNAPSADDDSIYLKFDDGEYAVANGLGTVGWQWVPVAKATLAAGDHSLTITYREDGVLLDKLDVTTFEYGPNELGEEPAVTSCGVQ